jgi:4-hydroxyphenylpyruvate dioxygenase
MNATEAMKTLPANPLGLDGVEFIEYAGSDRAHFEKLFQQFGFEEVGQVHGKNIKIYGQNDIHFILNCEPQTFAATFAQAHGPAICATGFRFLDAQKAFDLAVARGAKPYTGTDHEKGATPFPAIYGIGDSLIYFIDEANRKKLYESIFQIPKDKWKPKGFGFQAVDHFTNNVPRGEMQKWCDFYIKIFGFYEARFFDIRGSKTGLISKVMRSPCGKFSVPINEPTESKSQIQEYLDEYKGSGIQHLALTSENIVDSIQTLETKEVQFLTPPPKTYYDMIPTRVANVVENLEQLRKHAILVDGDQKGYLLQIFTKNLIGPIFFEVIQRKGHDGFGDGNFQALFDAIERDQKERGYL